MHNKKYTDICAIILAAGKGTRMQSAKPKVLHTLLGEYMLAYVLNSLTNLIEEKNIWTIIGYKKDMLMSQFPSWSEQMLEQAEQLGTGHAIQCSYPWIKKSRCDKCLVVNGDAPMLNYNVLQNLIQQWEENYSSIAFLTIELEDPTGYGRVIRDHQGRVSCIVEEKDIKDPETENIKEVNAGVYLISRQILYNYLHLLDNNNRQKEYYLTELIHISVKNNHRVDAYCAGKDSSLLGVNSPQDLINCEQILKRQRNRELADSGVILRNPESVRIGPTAFIHPDVDMTGPVEIYGDTEVESGCKIHSHVFIQDCKLGKDCILNSFSHLQGAYIENNCELGPFARIRAETQMEQEVRGGNFVEVKKSHLKKGCKANHLSYLGDAEVGEEANIGAGSITCNYDGKNKHVSVIGKRCFIGSNTSLIAPLRIGEDSLVAAGSTINRNVPENTLAVARTKQKNLQKKYVK